MPVPLVAKVPSTPAGLATAVTERCSQVTPWSCETETSALITRRFASSLPSMLAAKPVSLENTWKLNSVSVSASYT